MRINSRFDTSFWPFIYSIKNRLCTQREPNLQGLIPPAAKAALKSDFVLSYFPSTFTKILRYLRALCRQIRGEFNICYSTIIMHIFKRLFQLLFGQKRQKCAYLSKMHEITEYYGKLFRYSFGFIFVLIVGA